MPDVPRPGELERLVQEERQQGTEGGTFGNIVDGVDIGGSVIEVAAEAVIEAGGTLLDGGGEAVGEVIGSVLGGILDL